MGASWPLRPARPSELQRLYICADKDTDNSQCGGESKPCVSWCFLSRDLPYLSPQHRSDQRTKVCSVLLFLSVSLQGKTATWPQSRTSSPDTLHRNVQSHTELATADSHAFSDTTLTEAENYWTENKLIVICYFLHWSLGLTQPSFQTMTSPSL